jgi:hypothetical protein
MWFFRLITIYGSSVVQSVNFVKIMVTCIFSLTDVSMTIEFAPTPSIVQLDGILKYTDISLICSRSVMVTFAKIRLMVSGKPAPPRYLYTPFSGLKNSAFCSVTMQHVPFYLRISTNDNVRKEFVSFSFCCIHPQTFVAKQFFIFSVYLITTYLK